MKEIENLNKSLISLKEDKFKEEEFEQIKKDKAFLAFQKKVNPYPTQVLRYGFFFIT